MTSRPGVNVTTRRATGATEPSSDGSARLGSAYDDGLAAELSTPDD